MKHFTARLVSNDRQTRQWSIWADRLTVGSDPRCTLVLPSPAAALAGSMAGDAALDLPFGRLDVVEDTDRVASLWERARERMERSRLLGGRDPGEDLERARAAVLAGLGVIAVAGMVAMVRLGHRPAPVDDSGLPLQILELLPPQEAKVEPPKPPEPAAPAQSNHPSSAPTGGPSEDRTSAWKEFSDPHRDVMDHSVISKLNSMDVTALVGEPVDDEASDDMDVFLRGDAGNSMRKGGIGGRSSGDGDRMAGVAGPGLGNGGPAGRGLGTGSRQGRLTQGAGATGNGTGLRPRVAVPKPSDVVLDEEAGSRSPESILRVIRQGVGGFRYVYEKYLREKPELGGRISLRFTIAPSGDIIQIAVVSSNTGDEGLDENIRQQARKMKFDAIEKGNVTVTYAFLLDKQ